MVVAAALQTSGQPGAVEIPYCELMAKAPAFDGKTVRVKAMYETGFEKSVLSAPACAQSPTWLGLSKGWEKQTDAVVRDRIKDLKWSVPLEVVAVGVFRTDGKFGHMGMYSRYLLVDRFETAGEPAPARP